jgi:hypothetical protein
VAESPVAKQFEIPTTAKEPGTGIFGSGVGPTIKAGETDVKGTLRVVVREDGTTEFWQVLPGKDPERVVPTPQELAYAKEIVDAQQKANPPPRQPAPQTADEARLTKAQADKAEQAAKPEQVTRPAPAYSASGEAVPNATETVSTTQATYDLQRQQAQRQAEQDLQRRAEAAEQAAIARGRLAIEKDQLTAQQAHQRVQEELEKIRLEVSREQNAIAQRGQDLSAQTAREGHQVSMRGQDLQMQASREGNQVTQRGQDISAGVSQRGQDVSYETSLVGDTVRMADSMQNHAAPLWQIAQVDAATRGGWGAAIPPMQATPPMFGTDPTAFVTQAAQAARQNAPQRYQLPGADQYRLPG